MSKFNTTDHRATGRSPITTPPAPTTLTHEGAPGYVRDTKGELFLLAVQNMVNQKTFYESAAARDSRYEALVRAATVDDPEWVAAFLRWLRTDANMRSASLVGAAYFAHERLAQTEQQRRSATVTTRQVVCSVLQRADEPGEMLAFWLGRFGRTVPIAGKRGIGDAALRLYSEYSLLKYDTGSHGVRFADVLELTHPGDHKGARQLGMLNGTFGQRDLFKHAIDRRHHRDGDIPVTLAMLAANAALRVSADPAQWLDPQVLHLAGATWEDALSAVGGTVDKAKLWEALIPTMGYMAVLRNLRNFDEAGVSDVVAADVAARLASPAAVARSRQFPFRFLTAHLAAPSQRWGHALDLALTAACANIPELPGRTLVLVDTSASMTQGLGRSVVTPAWTAALFGVALAARNPGMVDLYGFADGVFTHDVPVGSSVLKQTERFLGRTGEVGHGTYIGRAVRATYNGHSRVVILSDMQTMADGRVPAAVPATVPMYGFNLEGYAAGALSSGTGNRHELGGLTDATFRMIPLLEAGRRAAWPWLEA